MTRSIAKHLSNFLFMVALLLPLAANAADTGAIPQRDEIEDQYKWRVEDIYETTADWDADLVRLEAETPRLATYKGTLADSPQQLLGCLSLSDSLDVIISNLYVYAYLKLDEDGRESSYQELGGRAASANTNLGAAQAFISPEILAIDRTKLEQFLSEVPALQTYRHTLDDLVRQQEHILSDKEENILAQAGNVLRAPRSIFNMLENADFRLGTVANAEGEEVELTWGRYSNIMRGTDRDYRRRASDTVQNQYLSYINTFGAALGASVQKDWFLAQVRGYGSCLEHSLDQDNIPVDVFRNLIRTVNDNLEYVHKLTALRKQVLGYDTLFTYDMAVPLVSEFEQQYDYEQAKTLLVDGLQPMGDQYLADVTTGLSSGWIDVYENEGKSSGAYSWGTYTSHPYILLNYAGRMEDVFTLAHEMGHALNSFYTNQTEPYAYHGHSLFTAEVASTCNEAVLIKHLLAGASTRQEKLALLDYYITQIDGTFITQVMFSEFELAIHEHVQNGGATSVDYFRKTYRDIYQKYHGPALVIGPNNDMSGMKISHFYREYYVYQYATCYAAAQALSQKILEKDPGALDRYMRFLATGTSKYPVEILRDAGVDMTSPEPVERTIKLFGELIDEMARLLSEG